MDYLYFGGTLFCYFFYGFIVCVLVRIIMPTTMGATMQKSFDIYASIAYNAYTLLQNKNNGVLST